ncbi:hypothetical protein [Streptomyces decoyicus]|uniref:hypothetical protein n=1 Tax=Streptomyces decoyicus TaxID=249567 RepID=UPI00386DAA52
MGDTVYGDASLADASFGDAEVVTTCGLLVTVEGLGGDSAVLGGEDDETFGDERCAVDAPQSVVVRDGAQAGRVGQDASDQLDEGGALVVTDGVRLADLCRMDSIARNLLP